MLRHVLRAAAGEGRWLGRTESGGDGASEGRGPAREARRLDGQMRIMVEGSRHSLCASATCPSMPCRNKRVVYERSFGYLLARSDTPSPTPAETRREAVETTRETSPNDVSPFGLGKWNCPNNRTGNRPGSLRLRRASVRAKPQTT